MQINKTKQNKITCETKDTYLHRNNVNELNARINIKQQQKKTKIEEKELYTKWSNSTTSLWCKMQMEMVLSVYSITLRQSLVKK